MPILEPYSSKTALQRLKPHLKESLHKHLVEIIALLDNEGRANVARIHETLFPFAKPASANAMLNHVLGDFNKAAENQGHALRLEITKAKNAGAGKRWVWFEGLAQGPAHQPTPDLDAIPAGQIAEQRGLPLNDPPVLVLLTFNEHEHRAVLQAFWTNGSPATETRAGITYNKLGIHGGMTIVHAIAEAGSGSLGASQQRTQEAIAAWQPRAVIAVGIAFGMDAHKQKIADVLVSSQLRLYELSRVNADGSLTPRGPSPEASAVLLNRIKTVDANHARFPEWPKIEFGQILSGEKLVDNLDYRASLKALYGPEAIGGEMEGSGLYVSAHSAKVDWIVVKAICDWADGKKSEDKTRRQIEAANNAVKVLKTALEQGNLFPEHPFPGKAQDQAAATPFESKHRKALAIPRAGPTRSNWSPNSFRTSKPNASRAAPCMA